MTNISLFLTLPVTMHRRPCITKKDQGSMLHAGRGIPRESSLPPSHTPTQGEPKASEIARQFPFLKLAGISLVFNLESKS